MKNARLYYGSGVLADGRVFVAGGEYNGGNTGVELDAAEVLDPVSGQWTDLPTPGCVLWRIQPDSDPTTPARVSVGD